VPNQGNIGLPMARLAFGPTGLAFATVLFAFGVILNASAAVALGALVLGEHTPRRALLAPLRYPSIYAAAAGVIVNVLNVNLPVAIEVPIATLAQAAIPCMLVVLGLSFQTPKLGDLEHPVAVSVNRLLFGPLAAYALASLVGLEGTARDVTILMAGMPAAVNTTILTARLGADVPLAVRIVVASTLLSIVTLTALLTIL
jgi:predicted permease